MQREIFIVQAYVVDANGTFNYLNGYPKTFDSRSYSNDIAKARQRAVGDCSEAFGAMCKVDTRQLQVAMVIQASDGLQIRCDTIGAIADLPDPEAQEG